MFSAHFLCQFGRYLFIMRSKKSFKLKASLITPQNETTKQSNMTEIIARAFISILQIFFSELSYQLFSNPKDPILDELRVSFKIIQNYVGNKINHLKLLIS